MFDIHSFADVLEEVSGDPYQCVVRGKIAETANSSRMLRRKLPRDNERPTLIETPRQWLLLDIDGLPTPTDFDPFAVPAETVALVIDKLPGVFRNVTCWYQFTASAGIKPGVRIRLGFWLDRPLGEAELKWWLGQSIAEPSKPQREWFKEFPVDTSLFGTVQPNYVAKPIIGEGAYDPLQDRCNRSGLILGAVNTVQVPEIRQPEGRWHKIKKESKSAAAHVPASNFNECLAMIGDHDGGRGCYEALKYAVAIYYRHRHMQAHEMRCAAEGNRLMSIPISETMT